MTYPPAPPARSGIGGTLALIGAIVVIAAGLVWVLLLASAAVSAPPREAPRAVGAPSAASPVPDAAGAASGEDSAPSPAGPVPDPAWVARVAAATGIPERAFSAYAAAALAISTSQPTCGLGWNTIAAIGAIESAHGSHAGAVLLPTGYTDPVIRGQALDGNGVAAIGDTDGGRWDGDTVWDRAVGPMQFIPSTWARWGSDGNGDGLAEPTQIDDAALAAARYLCASGSVTSPEAWRAAVFSYNNLESYVDDVARVASDYADRAG